MATSLLDSKWASMVQHDATVAMSGSDHSLRFLVTTAQKTAKDVKSRIDPSVILWTYLHDVWYGECAPGDDRGKTLELCELATAGQFDDARFAEICSLIHLDVKRTRTKLKNLIAAVEHVLHDEQFVFTVDGVLNVHKLVMVDLLDNAGCYRTTNAAPCGSNLLYVLPKGIPSRLAGLIAFTNMRMAELLDNESESPERCVRQFLLAALFMREFLLIHPFANGNGRVARLLLSHLLRDVILVPFTFTTTSRDQYIGVLERCGDQDAPLPLAVFIVREAMIMAQRFDYMSAE